MQGFLTGDEDAPLAQLLVPGPPPLHGGVPLAQEVLGRLRAVVEGTADGAELAVHLERPLAALGPDDGRGHLGGTGHVKDDVCYVSLGGVFYYCFGSFDVLASRDATSEGGLVTKPI